MAQREPDATMRKLADWLANRVGVTEPAVLDLAIPTTTGWSNETLLFTARWEDTDRRLVARVEPSDNTLFLEANFEKQYRVMKALAEGSDVPIPRLHWYEDDPSWLGGALWIMDRVDGDIPTDNPPYTLEGWLKESPPEHQEELWWSGLDAMARVHRADWRALGLDFLDDRRRVEVGLMENDDLAYDNFASQHLAALLDST